MRLNQFDLTRYGKFTDLSLPFAAPEAGKPDLHIIYGPNEAGKSTLLSGWLDLLFQIPTRSDMSFLHPYASMQLGATLEIDGGQHQLVRIKKPNNSLLDVQGAPVAEALLQGGLRGLDRAAYAAMFSLNGQTLDAGGESILASEGDLGQLLFQASAGLTDLGAQLDALREGSLEFLNATGRKGRLRTLKAAFDELGDQMKALDTAASDYARLAKGRDTARAAWQSARKEAEAAQGKALETERLLGALPVAGRLGRLDSQIADFGDVPEAPQGWMAELPALDRAETEMATLLETAAKAVDALAQELDAIPQDQQILDLSDDILAVEPLKSAYDTASADLPKRLKERDGEASSVRDCLARLGQSGGNPAQVLPEVAVSGRLRGLIEQYAGLESKHTSAVDEQDRAKAEAERTAQRLKSAGVGTADLAGLGGLVQGIRRTDPVGASDRAHAALAEAEAVWHEKRAALGPAFKEDATVAEVIAPDRAQLETLGDEITGAARQIEREQETLERLGTEMAQHVARQAAASASPLVTLEDAARVRAQRETDWAKHRAALSRETADQFEVTLRLDDQMSATVGDQRARAEMAQDAERVRVETQERITASEARLRALQARAEDLAKTLGAVVSGVSPLLAKDMTVAGLLVWMTRSDTARAALRHREEARRKATQATDAVARTRSGLVAALKQAGRDMDDGVDLPFAVETAQSLLDRATQIEAFSEAQTQAHQELARRDKALSGAQSAMQVWQADWAATCAKTWMADAPPSVSEMRAILDELDQLRRHFDRAADLDRRIVAMQTNRDLFAQAVQTLGARLGTAGDGSAEDLWRGIKQRLRNAEAHLSQRTDLHKRLEAAQKAHADLAQRAEIHQTRTQEFTRFFNVQTWPQAREALTQSGERAKRVADRRACAEELCALMRADTLDAALEALTGVDETSLQARAESLKTDLRTLRSNQEEAHTTFRKAEDELESVGGDGAVARLDEQRQTLLLEIKDGAQQHLQQRLGLLAVDTALRQYRDTHRSGMLERASEAFRTMSGGRYSGLAAQPDGIREVLVALAAEGGSKEATQLSDGTRAQLYLALRIAGYHEFVRNNGPVPFIADDIMESFDDARATETIGLLAKMSETGQVIYLTHHAHLCTIAKDACPSVQIHRLPV
jgi:uncharacterized protein YhaN